MTYEYIGNLHTHSHYSDGSGSFEDIARGALRAGLDFVVVTDHNVWVDGADGYRFLGDKRVLLLTGEEVHDQAREPQKNHLLIFEARRELAALAPEPQRLINAVTDAGGFSFLAHPLDPAAPLIDEPDLSWANWEVEGYTGIEIWNFMTEYKGLLSSMPRAIFLAYRPAMIASGPYPEVLARWDSLLRAGKRVVAIGNSDAHAMSVQKGPLKRVIFPYEYLFRAVNTHVLSEEPLSGDVENDRRRIFYNLSRGHCFVGYDLPAPTHGFRFTAQGDGERVMMGDSICSRYGITLQIKLPQPARIRLIMNGVELKTWPASANAVHTVTAPGAYRVEAHLPFQGKIRGWIFSNPIFVSA